MSITIPSGFFRRRPFTAWQIEVTTRCLLGCSMCVKESDPGWIRRDMAFDDFRKIVPHFRKVRRIVLEGWGESLLYPRLFDCIRLIKNEGAEAGFVTSGTGLDRAGIVELLDSGLDFIGFSFSGATAVTHNSIRKGSDFETLVESVRVLQYERRRTGMKGPRIHIVYLLLRDNIEEVGGLVDLAGNLDIRKIVLINPALISTRKQDAERAFADARPDKHFTETLQRAAKQAAKYRIEIVPPSLSPNAMGVCSEDPLRNLYISVNGEVAPCVFLLPPVRDPFTRFHNGREYAIKKIGFGNIFRTPFPEIWDSSGYKHFRKCFLERQAFLQRELQSSFGIYSDDALPQEMPEAPEVCRTCYKLSSF